MPAGVAFPQRALLRLDIALLHHRPPSSSLFSYRQVSLIGEVYGRWPEKVVHADVSVQM